MRTYSGSGVGGGIGGTCSSSGDRVQALADAGDTKRHDRGKAGRGGGAADGGSKDDGSSGRHGDDVQGRTWQHQDQHQQTCQHPDQEQQREAPHVQPDDVRTAGRQHDEQQLQPQQQQQDTERSTDQDQAPPDTATKPLFPSPFEAAAAAAGAYPQFPSVPPDSVQGSSGPGPTHLDRDSHNGHNGLDVQVHPDGRDNDQQLSAALNTCQLYERYGKLFMGYRGSRRAAATFKVVAVGSTVLAALLLGMQVR